MWSCQRHTFFAVNLDELNFLGSGELLVSFCSNRRFVKAKREQLYLPIDCPFFFA